MKRIDLVTEPFYNERTENLDRENSLYIEIDEYVPEKRRKPSDQIINQLREQKKKILALKKEFYEIHSIENKIGILASKPLRKENREKQINQIVELLKELQENYHFSEINRKFITNILKTHSSLKDTARQRIINEILERGKVKEKVYTKKYLDKDYHQVNLELKSKNIIIEFYSFK